MKTTALVASALMGLISAACLRTTRPAPSGTTEFSMHTVNVLDSHITYREGGAGPPVVFLHGNPTSSHVWRNVMPILAANARCLAPDLIGMGESGKPNIPYRFADHARYLDAWFDALDLRDVVLVGYDWGGALAMDWAMRHPHRVRGLVLLETFLRPMTWSDWPPEGAKLFQGFRTPGLGEKWVLEENLFIERALPAGVRSGLSAADMAIYRAPYPDAASRRPLLQWPREIPIEGEPADVVSRVSQYGAWMGTSRNVPKLLLTFQGKSVLGSPAMVDWARQNIASLEIAPLGPAGHHAPEDVPEQLGKAIRAWLERHRT
jgi:haloalkane dehalogenase